MKKLLHILTILAVTNSFAQNTFPTTGMVGIQNTSPDKALVVSGSARIDSSLTVQDSIIVNGRTRTFELVVQGNTKLVGAVVMKNTLKVDSTVRAKSNLIVDGETKMNGNAKAMANFTVNGIGKFNGAVKMHAVPVMSGTDTAYALFVGSNGNLYKTSSISMAPADPAGLCDPAGIPHPIWHNGTDKLYTICDVKVGIGTNDPLYRLHCEEEAYLQKILAGAPEGPENAVINGYIFHPTLELLNLGKRVGPDIYDRFTIKNNGATEIVKVDAGTALTINNGTGHALQINDNTGEAILLLQDDGLLKARKIRVDLDTWSDDVFEESYDLQTLDETEDYTDSTQHLPGVPSEAELKEKGLDVAQMLNVQMEKTEEVYLHLFEMNKRMVAMQLQMEQLLKENAELKAKISE